VTKAQRSKAVRGTKDNPAVYGAALGILIHKTYDGVRYLWDSNRLRFYVDEKGQRYSLMSDVVKVMRILQKHSSHKVRDIRALEALLPPDLRQPPADDPPKRKKSSK
jgi:hypothetical protein